jgi:phasin family protein
MAKSPFDFDVSKFFDFGKMSQFGGMGDFAKGMDMSKMMDMTKMFGNFNIPGVDMTKMFGNFNLPGVDLQAVMNSQRKNMEALTAANKLALEGMQAVFKRQAEILKQSIEEGSAATREVTTAGSPQASVAKQTDLAKAAFEKALSNAKELSEIVAKANGEAVELLNKRFAGMLDEFRDAVAKGKKP